VPDAAVGATEGRVLTAGNPDATITPPLADKETQRVFFAAEAARVGWPQEAQAQHFARVDALAPPGALPAAESRFVLQSFQVQQQGATICIVDADGSVYTGALHPSGESVRFDVPAARSEVPVALSRALSADRTQAKAAAPAAGESAPAPFAFRVSGSNATLGQNVVFIGNFLPEPTTNQLGRSHLLGNVAATAQADRLLLNNVRITGRAQLADGRELVIQAVPVAP